MTNGNKASAWSGNQLCSDFIASLFYYEIDLVVQMTFIPIKKTASKPQVL